MLRGAIARVAFAAATEESRPVLTGVEVKLTGGPASPWPPPTASGWRCSMVPLTQSTPEEMGVIIPARTMNELNRLLGDQQRTLSR